MVVGAMTAERSCAEDVSLWADRGKNNKCARPRLCGDLMVMERQGAE